MDEEIRNRIEEIEFNPQKCEEIITKIIEIVEENNCNNIEIDYILVVLKKEFDIYDMCNR